MNVIDCIEKARTNTNKSVKQPEENKSVETKKTDAKKVAATLAGLAAIGIASVLTVKNIKNNNPMKEYIKNNNLKEGNINNIDIIKENIKNHNAIKKIKDKSAQSIEKHFNKENLSRGKEALREYTAMSNQGKAASLRYKVENGMIQGKTPEQMEKIMANLQKLESVV